MNQAQLTSATKAKGVQATQTRQQIVQRIPNDLKFEKAGHDLTETESLEIVKIFMTHRSALALGTVKGVTVSIPTINHPPFSAITRSK